MDFTDDDIRSLFAKIDGLDLTDGERAALGGICSAAAEADAEAAGFAFGLPSFAQLSQILSNISQTRSEISQTFARNARA